MPIVSVTTGPGGGLNRRGIVVFRGGNAGLVAADVKPICSGTAAMC